MSFRKHRSPHRIPARGSTQIRRRATQGRDMTGETLEVRRVLSAEYQALDGTGNNAAHADWGSTGEDFLRRIPIAYADGISTPAGSNRPSAREISNGVGTQTTAITNDRQLSAMVYAWGQFIDHDIDLTSTATVSEFFNIAVPKGDPYFDPAGTGTQVIPLTRSGFDPATGTAVGNPRQQVNDITAFVDGSMIYGSDSTTAAVLRSFSGGKLNTSSGNLLPLDPATGNTFFKAGDIRANENIELLSMQTLFVREHNRIAQDLASKNPTWNDETLYQEARRRVIAEVQAITYNEFLPALLGSQSIKPYEGYKPNVNPDITNEFATAAFRVGHTMLGDDVEFLDNNGHEIRDAVALSDAFFNPNLLKETGIDPLLKYLASDNAQEIDTQLVDSVRNFLFGPPGSGGLDLASLNIQRGRDHGLADYNSTRAAYGLPKVKSFADITSDPQLQSALQKLYKSVDNIDLWVGGLAEDHVKGSSVGPLFGRIIGDQFARLRDGDRFWYERNFNGPELDKLRHTSLADVIRSNSTITNLQDNVFVFNAQIQGRVFADANSDGKANPGEQGLGGRIVQLIDDTGSVIASTLTKEDGSYRFERLGLGTYQVREIVQAGSPGKAAPLASVTLTKGGAVLGIDLGELPPSKQTPPGNNKPAPPAKPPALGPRTPPSPGALDAVFVDATKPPVRTLR